jgi:hypothetical protein
MNITKLSPDQVLLESNKNQDIISKILNLIDLYNDTSQRWNNNENSQNEQNKLDYINKNKEFTSNISEIIFNGNNYDIYEQIKYIKTAICNILLLEILINSPVSDINIIKFNNIKTQLYPYQINNLNWMINIEKNIYDEEHLNISKKIVFKGGGLFDEVGMGKTLQMITLMNYNRSTHKSLIKHNKIYCKATLIIVPNHLCGQWLREIQLHIIKPLNIINLLTKKHYKKYTFFDLAKADVVIVSSNFFINCNLNQHDNFDPLSHIINIFDKNVNIFNVFWHRVAIDEFHEMECSDLFERLKYIESDYRWVISGTPFKEKSINSYLDIEKTSLSTIIDFLTHKINVINTIDIYENSNYKYIKNHFSRNTHIKNVKILKLPEIVEETIWLNFTETERMIYNAYLADPNNNAYDVFLRQICCHPMISDKIRENISNKVESLSDIQDLMRKMYFTEFDKADENYNSCSDRITRMSEEIDKMKSENKTNLIGYKDLQNDLEHNKIKIVELKKVRDGKEKTLMYYKTFLDIISDMEKVVQEECPICLDNIKQEDIGITFCGHMYCYTCISTIIKESKKSGIPCRCPNCKSALELDKIFLISENKSEDVNSLGTKLSYIINYIKNTPHKYRIIFSQWDYLLKEVGKVLGENGIKHLYCQGNVYQKDKVLRLFNSNSNNSNNIHNNDNIDNIDNIDNNEYKIIMLSSDSTVSGSNLNNAEEVIFLDPVYGDKQYRLNTENQAIGRVRRLGNKYEKIKVLRLLIRDSIEEEIFKANQN